MSETQTTFVLREARKTGAIAAQACADAADRRSPGWTNLAYDAFVVYAKVRGTNSQFTTEDVRNGVQSVPPAPDGRAWGAIALRAKRAGLIVPCGYRGVESSNGSPKTLWKLNPESK